MNFSPAVTGAAALDWQQAAVQWRRTAGRSGETLLSSGLHGCSYLLGQRFRSCFVLKFAPQRGEGEEREGGDRLEYNVLEYIIYQIQT